MRVDRLVVLRVYIFRVAHGKPEAVEGKEYRRSAGLFEFREEQLEDGPCRIGRFCSELAEASEGDLGGEGGDARG